MEITTVCGAREPVSTNLSRQIEDSGALQVHESNESKDVEQSGEAKEPLILEARFWKVVFHHLDHEAQRVIESTILVSDSRNTEDNTIYDILDIVGFHLERSCEFSSIVAIEELNRDTMDKGISIQ